MSKNYDIFIIFTNVALESHLHYLYMGACVCVCVCGGGGKINQLG